MVYALLVEKLEAAVLTERQVCAALLASGRYEVEMPSLHQARVDFDAALTAPPAVAQVVDLEQWQLRRVLGVA